MLEARDFTVFTDHKPLIYAFRQKSDKCSPRQIRQLDFISQFNTNIVHIPGSDNIAADVLSRVSAITFPSQIDYDCIAETQQTDQELHTLIASGTSLELKKKCRTTGYHPQANRMIEELHRPLKSAIKCHATERWTEVLPIILQGLRASLKEDILCTPAELVFGTTIRLPGEMFDSSKPDDDVVNFVSKLKSHMQSLHPKPPKHHGKRPVFIHPGLLEATHVFLRRGMLRRPLQQPYDGPFKVLQRKDKVFFLTSMNEIHATVEPNATASTPATVESDPTASTPTQPSTRSGRKVHLPTRYRLTLEGDFSFQSDFNTRHFIATFQQPIRLLALHQGLLLPQETLTPMLWDGGSLREPHAQRLVSHEEYGAKNTRSFS
ncbi:integrase catalytic domain-containing protein [Trichonephila clavipes]|nr:integrase catalytic domain-containing protein [Trichonephila clavipes]